MSMLPFGPLVEGFGLLVSREGLAGLVPSSPGWLAEGQVPAACTAPD